MKSIMEEASSTMKAIENGWIRAGKPEEFSVRVFEEAEKNFFGFTTKPAKIGIFIPANPSNQSARGSHIRETSHNRSQAPQDYSNNAAAGAKTINRQTAPSVHKPKTNPTEYRAESNDSTTTQGRRPLPGWTEELSDFAQQWLAQSLSYLPISDATVTKDVSQEVLSLYVASPLANSNEKEQALFKSLAHLTMEALRNKFKQNFRSLRILINHK